MRKTKINNSISTRITAGASLWAIGASPGLATDTVDPELLSAMEWRLVGPYRGGRVTTVAGIPNNPQLYYMGATGGGVWKTENAGLSWENISDGFFGVGTIGAVAVAESDPNVIYVGTGEKSLVHLLLNRAYPLSGSRSGTKGFGLVGVAFSANLSLPSVRTTLPKSRHRFILTSETSVTKV
jgi:hypothetical protein